MRSINNGRVRSQISFLRQQFLQGEGLPFGEVLTSETLSRALATIEKEWLDRIYTPLITLRVFLWQALSADHSCRAAVAQLIAYRVSQGLKPCSAETSAYCQARKRLPEEFFATTARETAATLDKNVKPEWLWKQRRVLIYDGSTVSMPDTAENQRAYPQPPQQAPGIGFPIARIAAFFSFSCGVVLDLDICSNSGKGHSELGMLRKMWGLLQPGDILLADRYMCAYREIHLLKQRGVDIVTRLHHCRKADFRRGQRLGKGDHLVEWTKPFIRSVKWQEFKKLPDKIMVRETRVRVEQLGFRSRDLIVVSTLLDAEEYTKQDIAELYRARWNCELDLRSLKETLQMDILRCKTPELVRKEIWAHLLAYNLIRTVIAQAAHKHHLEPRPISFKGAVQSLEAFQPPIALLSHRGPVFRQALYDHLLDAIATHRVGDRPDRFEPRQRKRRPKKHIPMCKPRSELKRQMVK